MFNKKVLRDIQEGMQDWTDFIRRESRRVSYLEVKIETLETQNAKLQGLLNEVIDYVYSSKSKR